MSNSCSFEELLWLLKETNYWLKPGLGKRKSHNGWIPSISLCQAEEVWQLPLNMQKPYKAAQLKIVDSTFHRKLHSKQVCTLRASMMKSLHYHQWSVKGHRSCKCVSIKNMKNLEINWNQLQQPTSKQTQYGLCKNITGIKPNENVSFWPTQQIPKLLIAQEYNL